MNRPLERMRAHIEFHVASSSYYKHLRTLFSTYCDTLGGY